jgi:hypothetical protein
MIGIYLRAKTIRLKKMNTGCQCQKKNKKLNGGRGTHRSFIKSAPMKVAASTCNALVEPFREKWHVLIFH